MSFSYTSQDAYNGCLSLFSESDAIHRGFAGALFNKMRITGDISKTSTGFEFMISRIKSSPCQRDLKGSLIDDRFDMTGNNEEYRDYIIPTNAYAKIILTTDTSLFPSQKTPRYAVTLQFSNFDFSDLVTWPPLKMSTIIRSTRTLSGESCSISLGMTNIFAGELLLSNLWMSSR